MLAPRPTVNDPPHHHGRHRQKWPPIAAHKLQCQSHTCWINSKQCPTQADIFFIQWRGLSPLKRSDDKVRFIAIIASPLERFKGDRPPHCKKKTSACLGHRSPLLRRVCSQNWSSCAAIGGHFWWRRPWLWCGCSPLTGLKIRVRESKLPNAILNPLYVKGLKFRPNLHGGWSKSSLNKVLILGV